jgi:molecular chaperone GrpE
MSKSEPKSAAPESQENAGAPEPSADAAVADAAARVAALEAEVSELKDRALRAHAELENYRRRAEREREDTAKFAVTRFARDLLSVADNLRRAIDNAPKEGDDAVKSLLAGVAVTERELLAAFERHQVKPIEALGQRFDANFHEAVVEIPDPSKPAGTIVQVMAPGYTIAGRLLRAAMVGVAKGGPKELSGQTVNTSA